MKNSDKIITGASAGVGALGTATAVGGKAILWSIFSAGPGATLAGAAETSHIVAEIALIAMVLFMNVQIVIQPGIVM